MVGAPSGHSVTTIGTALYAFGGRTGTDLSADTLRIAVFPEGLPTPGKSVFFEYFRKITFSCINFAENSEICL